MHKQTGATPEEGHQFMELEHMTYGQRLWKVCLCVQLGGKKPKFSCCLQQYDRWFCRRRNQTLLKGAKTAKKQWSQISTMEAPKENIPYLGISQVLKRFTKRKWDFQLWRYSKLDCACPEHVVLTVILEKLWAGGGTR